MGSIICQTAIGEPSGKAVTESSYQFCSMINTGAFQYGMNSDGIYLLNDGETDSDVEYERDFTIATSDFGMKNPKRCRYLHIGYEADDKFDVQVRFDDGDFLSHDIKTFKQGLHRVRVPISRKLRGMFMSVRIKSSKRFRIDKISADFIILSTGTRGY